MPRAISTSVSNSDWGGERTQMLIEAPQTANPPAQWWDNNLLAARERAVQTIKRAA
jgi:hypothetical protein